MQTLIKKIFAVILITLIVSCSLIPALAAYADINASTTRIASLKLGYGGTQGLSVTASGANKRLFVVRVSDTNTNATLYMYKDYTTMSNNNNAGQFGTFNLPNLVGHANGMAIDDDYIYILRGNNESFIPEVLRIKRSHLWSMYNNSNDVNKGDLTINPGKVDILTAEYSDGSQFNVGVTKEKDADKIHAITYYKDGKFIIKTTKTIVTDVNTNIKTHYLNFTTAEVVGNKLVVSKEASDKFQVVFDTTNTHGQDIGYDPDCGLFIVISEEDAPYNKILWINLNDNNRVYTQGSSDYRIINVNKSPNIFEKYELESVSIGSDNHMYASVNTFVIGQGEKEGSDYPQYETDPIIKIERPTAIDGDKRFLISTFDQ